jgi:hypothetical protein
MQEEKKSKQKNDENLYRKILYTTLYNIDKESLMIINSFGIPKTKPKQSRQLPKTPKQNKQNKKPKIITKYQ